MLRRLALIVALFSPVAGLASVVITPTELGKADCTSSSPVTFSWTSTGTWATNDIFRVWVSTSTSCPSTGDPTGTPTPKQVPGGDIPATSVSGNYPVSGTYARSAFIADAGAGACTANATIYVCVQHLGSDLTTGKAVMTGIVELVVLPPSIPVSVAVAPGDSALFVSWADGTDSTVAAVSYNVTAVGGGVTVAKNSTSKSYRLGGLTNGTTYGVTVASVSAGGNVSAATNAIYGTPQPVDGFWEQYHNADGREQGGCAGGPAGVVALLGAALALHGLRRRS